MAIFMDIKGSSQTSFQFGKGGLIILNETGTRFRFKNKAGTLKPLLTNQLQLGTVGDSLGIVFNQDSFGASTKLLSTNTPIADITLFLPNSVGTNGQVLASNGLGNMVWTTISVPSTGANISSATALSKTIKTYFANVSGGTFPVTLPALVIGDLGVEIRLKNISFGSPNTVTVTALAGTIEGGSSDVVAAGEFRSYNWNGSNWFLGV